MLPTGVPWMNTVDAPHVRSAALKVLGRGVGMGPAGGEGGHRQTSGIAMPWAELPAWTAAIPLMKTLSPIVAFRERYSGSSTASTPLTRSVVVPDLSDPVAGDRAGVGSVAALGVAHLPLDPRQRLGNEVVWPFASRSEEHTSELQSLRHLVCRLLLEKKNNH